MATAKRIPAASQPDRRPVLLDLTYEEAAVVKWAVSKTTAPLLSPAQRALSSVRNALNEAGIQLSDTRLGGTGGSAITTSASIA